MKKGWGGKALRQGEEESWKLKSEREKRNMGERRGDYILDGVVKIFSAKHLLNEATCWRLDVVQ